MILQSPNQSSPLRLGSDLPIPPLHSLSPSNTGLLVDPHTGQKLPCRSTSEYSCILLTEHSSPDICMLLPHLVQACALLTNSQGSFKLNPTSTLFILFLCFIFLHSTPCQQKTNYLLICLLPIYPPLECMLHESRHSVHFLVPSIKNSA